MYLTDKSNWDIDVISDDESSARLKHLLCCSSSVRLGKIFAAKSCDRLVHVESDSWSFETSSARYCFVELALLIKSLYQSQPFPKFVLCSWISYKKIYLSPSARGHATCVVSIPGIGSRVPWRTH